MSSTAKYVSNLDLMRQFVPMGLPDYSLLSQARTIIEKVPEENFDLQNIVRCYGQRKKCGTIACAAGWLAMSPEFQKLGLDLVDVTKKYRGSQNTKREIALSYKGMSTDYQSLYSFALAPVFNITLEEADTLFETRDCEEPEELTDKQVFLNRIDAFVAKAASEMPAAV